MDPAAKSSIISRHAHLISSQRLNSINIRHLVGPTHQDRHHARGTPSESVSSSSISDEPDYDDCTTPKPTALACATSSVPAAGSPHGSSSVDDSGPPSPARGHIPNFGIVGPGIYRSSFPYACNLDHVRELDLKCIVTLVKTPIPMECTQVIRDEGIRHHRIIIPPHKHGQTIDMESIVEVMRIIEDPGNHPVLIHCNKGKHRTGCMVACHRALSGWNIPDILTEYRQYASDKARPSDEAFITTFRPLELKLALTRPGLDPSEPINYTTCGGLPTPPASSGGFEEEED